MQCQRRRHAVFRSIEGDLGIDHAGEEIGLAFGERLDFSLSRPLHEQPVAFSTDRQREIRIEFVASRIGRKDLRIDRDGTPQLGERVVGIDEMDT